MKQFFAALGEKEKKMARPKKADTPIKGHFVGFWLSEDLFQVVKTEARKAGLSQSEYWRSLAAKQNIKQRPVLIHDVDNIVAELRQINKIGSNLNEIARYFNEHGLMTNSLAIELRETLNLLQASCSRLDQAVEKEYGNS